MYVESKEQPTLVLNYNSVHDYDKCEVAHKDKTPNPSSSSKFLPNFSKNINFPDIYVIINVLKNLVCVNF